MFQPQFFEGMLSVWRRPSQWGEVGGVWRQVKEPAPHISQNHRRRLVVMCGEVVATDDSSRLQFRSKNVSDICFKDLTIHCAFNDPRRNQIAVHQACNERLDPRAPNGAPISRRLPHKLRPYWRDKLVFMDVSSMKTS